MTCGADQTYGANTTTYGANTLRTLLAVRSCRGLPHHAISCKKCPACGCRGRMSTGGSVHLQTAHVGSLSNSCGQVWCFFRPTWPPGRCPSILCRLAFCSPLCDWLNVSCAFPVCNFAVMSGQDGCEPNTTCGVDARWLHHHCRASLLHETTRDAF